MNEQLSVYAGKKSVLIGLSVVVVLIFGSLIYYSLKQPKPEETKPSTPTSTTNSTTTTSQALRPEDATYRIEDRDITLTHGRSEQTNQPPSEQKIITQIFGSPVFGDLDEDGDADAALFLTQQTGGSGTFYYAVGAINTKGEYKGTRAFFLGDRIAPQTLGIRDGLIVANYAIRKEGEPMTQQPSVGVSKYLELSGVNLDEVLEPGIYK